MLFLRFHPCLRSGLVLQVCVSTHFLPVRTQTEKIKICLMEKIVSYGNLFWVCRHIRQCHSASYHVVDLRHVKEPYTAWVRCFVGQIYQPLFLTRDSPASLPDGSGCWMRMIWMRVLGLQTSHLLLKYTKSGYGTVLTAACARQGSSVGGFMYLLHCGLKTLVRFSYLPQLAWNFPTGIHSVL
jgi:hypothetical protein